MIRQLIATLTVVLVAFAGCIGGGDADEQMTTDEPVPSSADPNDAQGVIAGLIVTEEGLPVAGAQVGVRGMPDLMTTTSSLGGFELGPLDPGSYVLDVAKLGFEPVAHSVTVVAGEAAEVEVKLVQAADVAEAFMEVSHFTAFYDCALGAVVWVSSCTYPYTAAYLTLHDNGVNLSSYGVPPDAQRNEFRYNFTVAPTVEQIISEVEWQPNSAAARTMQIILSCPDYDPVLDDCEGPQYGSAEGESPLRIDWKGSAVGNRPNWVMERVYLPFFEPQVAVGQKIEMWNTMFHNGPAPDGFTILDGDA